MSTPAAFTTVAPSGSEIHRKLSALITPVLLMSSSQNTRSHGSVYNHANGAMFIRFGNPSGLAPTGSFDIKLASGSLFELPKPTYQGEMWGTWDAAGGFAFVLELGTNGD